MFRFDPLITGLESKPNIPTKLTKMAPDDWM